MPAPQVTARCTINISILSLDEEPHGRLGKDRFPAALDEGELGTYTDRVETHFESFIHSSALVRPHFATVWPP